jgi:hypothetical protein
VAVGFLAAFSSPYQALALILKRPIAWFRSSTPENKDLVERPGRRSHELETNERGENPDRWWQRVKNADVHSLVEFLTPESQNL